LKKAHVITLYTDSQYVKNGITLWIDNWQRNNWKTSDKKSVKNVDLWKDLIIQKKRHQIIWKWVRGHDSNTWNERADQLAVAARRSDSTKMKVVTQTEESTEEQVHLYTGVTCKHSSGVGAWSLLLCWRHHVKIMGERVEGMTANQLYIHAVIKGLGILKKQLPVIVHTHSGYLRDGACSWLPGWKQRNWLTREGTPVSNRELWQELSALLEKQDVTFRLDDRENPLCHMLEAKELAREFEQE
jgi:ribonuclease HI